MTARERSRHPWELPAASQDHADQGCPGALQYPATVERALSRSQWDPVSGAD